MSSCTWPAEQFALRPASPPRSSQSRRAIRARPSRVEAATGASLIGPHLETVDAAIAHVSRRKLLSSDEREELRSCVYIKLLDRDGEVLRQFRGDSHLRTFLFVVVERVLLDLRNAKWGKWRPTAAARRLGEAAVRLETLVGRDGLTREEAEGVMRREGEWPLESAQQRQLDLLPARLSRRFIDMDQVEGLRDPSADPEARLIAAAPDSRRRALRRVIAALDPEDRTLLRLRFDEHLPVGRIASLTGMTTAAAYRRFDAIYRRLRATLGARRQSARSIPKCGKGVV